MVSENFFKYVRNPHLVSSQGSMALITALELPSMAHRLLQSRLDKEESIIVNIDGPPEMVRILKSQIMQTWPGIVYQVEGNNESVVDSVFAKPSYRLNLKIKGGDGTNYVNLAIIIDPKNKEGVTMNISLLDGVLGQNHGQVELLVKNGAVAPAFILLVSAIESWMGSNPPFAPSVFQSPG